MQRKSIFLSLGIVIVGLLNQACTPAESAQVTSKEAGIPVRVIDIKTEIWNPPIHTSGRFASEDENLLAFKTGGIIDQIFVREGEAIKRGQVLATLNLTEISALTAQAEFGFEKAKRDHERAEKLFADSVVTLEQLQNSLTALDIARQLLQQANFNKSHSEIRATADGFVLQKMASSGQVVAGGMPVLLTSGGANTGWVLKTGLSDKAWAQIQVGDSAEITSAGIASGPLKSRVVRKSKSAQTMSGSFIVELAVSDPGQNIASGMFGKATIYPTSNVQSWSIPYSALLDANAGKGYVFVTSNDTAAEKTEVEIGEISNDHVQILRGLETHSRLIVSGSPYLTDGSAITIIK